MRLDVGRVRPDALIRSCSVTRPPLLFPVRNPEHSEPTDKGGFVPKVIKSSSAVRVCAGTLGHDAPPGRRADVRRSSMHAAECMGAQIGRLILGSNSDETAGGLGTLGGIERVHTALEKTQRSPRIGRMRSTWVGDEMSAADQIVATPPSNDSDRGRERKRGGNRWHDGATQASIVKFARAR